VQQSLLYVCIKAVAFALVVTVLLRAAGERPGDLGFRLPSAREAIVIGVPLTLALFVVVNVVLNTALAAVMGGGSSRSIAHLFRDPSQAPLWILTAIIGGGFAEELERAFILTRFERLFGRPGLVTALVLSTIVFGIGHLYQGPSGAISAACTGLAFAFVFLRRRRVIDAMLVHAAFDLLGIAAAYALYGRG
jgi:membrane protease YdiL (CAAX protease family)